MWCVLEKDDIYFPIARVGFRLGVCALYLFFSDLLFGYKNYPKMHIYRKLFPSKKDEITTSMTTYEKGNVTTVFSCDQAALWMVQSVRPSVRMSVLHTFLLCSHPLIIMELSGVITNDRSDVHTNCQGHKSKVKVTEVITQTKAFPDCII